MLAGKVAAIASPRFDPAAGRPSLAMRLIATTLRRLPKALADTDAFATATLARGDPVPAPLPAGLRARLDVREETIAGYRVITLAPKRNGCRRRIIYTHGGAYVYDMFSAHWSIVDALITATRATVIVPLYPLAPEHDHRPAFAFLEEVYRRTLKSTPPADVVLAGDSAGGGLALALAIDFRDKGLPMPGRVILFSPWLDITLADPQARAVEPRDSFLTVDTLRLCGIWWANGVDPNSSLLSPFYADLTGLPPIHIYQGTDDILSIDARSFAARATAHGVSMRYREYAGAFHVFVTASFTPEAKHVFRDMASTLTEEPVTRSTIKLLFFNDLNGAPCTTQAGTLNIGKFQ